MKTVNLAPRHLESVQNKERNHVMLADIASFAEYRTNERLGIRVGGTPVAEGIIKSVSLQRIDKIISEEVAKGEKTTDKMNALNDYCIENLNRRLRMNEIVIVIRWEYSDPTPRD